MKEHRGTREPVTVKGLLTAFGIGLAMAMAILVIGGVPEKGTEAFWKKLCDACTVPGILLTGRGLLSLLSDQGAFDGLSFTVRKAFGQILSEKRREAMPKTYYDYVSARREKAGGRSNSTLWTGIAFLAAAGALLLVYLNKYPI